MLYKMSIPLTYNYVKVSTTGTTKKSFEIIGDKAYFKINNIETNTAVKIDNETTIYFLESNVYNLTFTIYIDGCPSVNIPINVETITNPSPDDLNLTITHDSNKITIFGEIPATSSFKIFTDAKLLRYFNGLELSGLLGISNYINAAGEIVYFDILTKARYIPQTPGTISLLPYQQYPPPDTNPYLPGQYPNLTDTFPWTQSIIPWKQNQEFPSGPDVIITPPVPSSPNPPYTYTDQYDKFKSVPDTILAYLDINMEQVQPKDPKWTLFLTNMEDRGYSGDLSVPKWQSLNYQKKTYMSALTLDKLQFYLPKIDAFVNNSLADVTIYGQPLASSFQTNVILFFLRMHIGQQDYPDYIIKYFRKFIEFIGGSNDPLLYGMLKAPEVFEYFRQKNIEVVKNADKTCIAYWLAQSGLSEESLLFECVHNIVAFSQFTNVLYSTVYAVLHPVNPLDSTLPEYPNFFEKYTAAADSNERLDVVRELFRILVPNSGSFSVVKPIIPDENVIKSRHNHQDIMIQNSSSINDYFTYDTNKYASFSTNLDNLEGLPVITDILSATTTSPLDQETVVDTSTIPVRPIMPLFPTPTYCPFGLGYRRCPGELIVYLVVEKLLEKFATIKFEERPGSYPLVSVAGFKQVIDNIFAIPL